MTRNAHPATLSSMRSIHQIPAPARRELLDIIRVGARPESTMAEMRRALTDAQEMLESDNLRSGYAQRFKARTVRSGVHLIWTGAGQDAPDGKPVCDFEGKRVYAAKVAWLLERLERVPDTMSLRKVCDIPRCIAPACHIQVVREDARGRPFAIRLDDEGRPVCKKGHLLKRAPKPREHIYCAPCEAQKKIDHEEADRVRYNVERYRISHQMPGRTLAVSSDLPAPRVALPTPQEIALQDYTNLWNKQAHLASGEDPENYNEDLADPHDPRIEVARDWLRNHERPDSPYAVPLGQGGFWGPENPPTVLRPAPPAPKDWKDMTPEERKAEEANPTNELFR